MDNIVVFLKYYNIDNCIMMPADTLDSLSKGNPLHALLPAKFKEGKGMLKLTITYHEDMT